jgi:threonine/homoserine/homoserine lactone efflux protein
LNSFVDLSAAIAHAGVSSGYAAALIIGTTWGIITSIPLGPTGALVLECATTNNRRGIYLAAAGFAVAHLIFQLVYHLGFASLITGNSKLITTWALPGVAMMVIYGIRHMFKGKQILSEKQQVESSFSENPPKPSKSVLYRSFGLAIFNPILLLYMIFNSTLFVAAVPMGYNPIAIAMLLMAALFGTVFWYIIFGEFVFKRAHGWNKTQRACAEFLTGIVLIAAGLAIAVRLAA